MFAIYDKCDSQHLHKHPLITVSAPFMKTSGVIMLLFQKVGREVRWDRIIMNCRSVSLWHDTFQYKSLSYITNVHAYYPKRIIHMLPSLRTLTGSSNKWKGVLEVYEYDIIHFNVSLCHIWKDYMYMTRTESHTPFIMNTDSIIMIAVLETGKGVRNIWDDTIYFNVDVCHIWQWDSEHLHIHPSLLGEIRS